MPWNWLAGWGHWVTPDLFNLQECCHAGVCIVRASLRPAELSVRLMWTLSVSGPPFPPKKRKKNPCLSSPNPFFSAVHPQISANKRYQQVWEWEWVVVDGLKSTCTQRGLYNVGARLTLVANLNELETSFFLSSSLSRFFFPITQQINYSLYWSTVQI